MFNIDISLIAIIVPKNTQEITINSNHISKLKLIKSLNKNKKNPAVINTTVSMIICFTFKPCTPNKPLVLCIIFLVTLTFKTFTPYEIKFVSIFGGFTIAIPIAIITIIQSPNPLLSIVKDEPFEDRYAPNIV